MHSSEAIYTKVIRCIMNQVSSSRVPVAGVGVGADATLFVVAVAGSYILESSSVAKDFVLFVPQHKIISLSLLEP